MWIMQSASQAYDDTVRTIQDGGALARGIYNNIDLIDNGVPYRAAIADRFDKTVVDNDKFIDHSLQSVANLALAKWESKSILDNVEGAWLFSGVGSYYAVNKFVTTVAKGYVDVLRLGEGTLREKSLKGVGMDALRIMQILPTSATSAGFKWLAGTGRMKLLALAPKQAATSFECTTNSAVRAMLLTGFKFFRKVTDIWESAGMKWPGGENSAIYIFQIEEALRKVGARVSPAISVGTMNEVMVAAARNPNSVVMFSATSGIPKAGEVFGPVSHTMLASAMEGGVRFYDTTGQVFRNLGEFEVVYRYAKPFHLAIMHETAVVQATREAMQAFGPSVVHLLGLGVRQAPMMPLVMDRVAAYVAAGTASAPARQPIVSLHAPAPANHYLSANHAVPKPPTVHRSPIHKAGPPPQLPGNLPLYNSDGPPPPASIKPSNRYYEYVHPQRRKTR